jgi:hypothetical protein
VQVAALRRPDPPSKESFLLFIGLRNSKSDQSSKGCRATERSKISHKIKFFKIQDYVKEKYFTGEGEGLALTVLLTVKTERSLMYSV